MQKVKEFTSFWVAPQSSCRHSCKTWQFVYTAGGVTCLHA